ncbi:unnamed protein product [Spirodela intermedia]|uniref:CRC domain-containing protein n=2 Tax=Spirodela intermedia TaxID=51605 RepID=A0A7I8JNR7_SPIIN|nr:unnamed protein product [Spirodela intermedia]CAA6671740.1 unnamed protein product [Spirodela intermedia]CAA7408857.1 unnamed protein product [Spirodela intermedia]
MDSPESTVPAPAALSATVASPSGVQESPFFTYVSNLSPIKLTSDVCAPSAIRELSFPSPSPVFRSPHVNPVRKDKFLKRSQHLSPDSGKFSLGYTGNIREILEKTSHYGGDTSQSIMVPCTMSTNCEHPTRLLSCSSPSDCVDEFFADPVEDSVNSSALSNPCLDQAIELGLPSQGGFGSPNKTPKVEPVQFQGCNSSGYINEILSYQEGDRKTNDYFDKFPAHYPPQVVEVVSNSSTEASKKFYPQVGNIKNGELESVESPTMVCQAEENPELDIPLIQMNCDQDKDSINVADDCCENNDRQLSPCTKLVAQTAMKYNPSKVLASDLHGFQLTEGHTANSDISVVPESVEDDSEFSKKEKSTIPLDCSNDADVLTERDQSMEWDSNSQVQPKSLEVALPDESQQCNSTSLCSSSIKIGVSNEQACLSSKPQWEGCQLVYAMRRRLEFMHSAVQVTNLESSRSLCNIDERILKAESPSGSLDLETRNASHNESVGASDNVLAYFSPDLSHFQKDPDSSAHALCKPPFCKHQTAEANADRFDLSIQKNGSSSATDPRPAGIGLHLNSVGNALAKDCNVNTQLVDRDLGKDSLTSQLEKGLCSSDQNMIDSKGCSTSMTLTSNVSVQTDVNSHSALVCSSIDKSEHDQQKNLDITVSNYSLSLQYTLIVNPLKTCLPPTFVSQVAAPSSVKRDPEGSWRSEDLNEMSPKKKSKKSPENDGCKRCNCKKSKCLKLYCDCFAAGMYCTDTCACQGCLNRPDYEDTVLETRQQIETRNPLAFAPKVVVHDAAASRVSGDDDKHTPASARHKRGCNCKRSHPKLGVLWDAGVKDAKTAMAQKMISKGELQLSNAHKKYGSIRTGKFTVLLSLICLQIQALVSTDPKKNVTGNEI